MHLALLYHSGLSWETIQHILNNLQHILIEIYILINLKILVAILS
jgi:hypothetical protein